MMRKSKRAKDELKKIENRLRATINSIAGNHWCKNKEGVYIEANLNLANLLGIKPSDLIGKTDYDMSWKDAAAELIAHDNFVMEQDKAITREETVLSSDNTILTFLVTKAPLKDLDGLIIGTVGTSVDITELKEAQKRLEVANQAKTEFVQNMQHDIRTPAAGLWGVLDILAKAEANPRKKETLDMAVAASKRLLDLCNDAVEFGDLHGNVRPILEKALNLRELAQSVIELNKPAAFARDLLLHFKVDASVPVTILSDEFRLSRILINVMGNAIKFTHKGEVALILKAEVDKETRRGWLTLEIKDTGIGIAPEKIKIIYEKFSRAVASNTNLYPGTGLGLYVVKTFMDELNGDIELESYENEGTHFKLGVPFKMRWEDMKKPGIEINESFKSPLKKETTPESIFPQISQAKTPFTHTLLIIEDDKTCLFAEKNLLSAYTNHIDIAENVAEALEKLGVKRYDLVISDLGLPDGSGNDIVAQIKATPESLNYNTPFVAMTAHQDALKHQQARDVGFAAIDTKPLGAEKVVELLNAYPADGSATQPKVEGYPVIDLAVGMQRIAANDEGPAIEALNVLWETLQKDIPLLRLVEERNDIEAANALLLKVRGGLYYSGTPRLEETCDVLYKEVQYTQDLREIKPLFSLVYDEAKIFSEQFNELLKGVNVQKEWENVR